MKKYKNIYTGHIVTVTERFIVDGREVVNYVKDVKQNNELGNVIDSHDKPAYVFDATYKEVNV